MDKRLVDLTKEAEEWFAKNNFQPMCAWDFLAEVQARLFGEKSNFIPDDVPVTQEHANWLSNFVQRWWDVEDEIDGKTGPEPDPHGGTACRDLP